MDHFVSWNAGAQNKDLDVYDASGNRVLHRTTTSSGTTMTAYAFGVEEHSYFNTGGHKGDLYYYTLGGRLLGALDNTGKTTFYLTDALGSVLASFSNTAGIAAIKGNQVFGPYGNPRDSQGTINTAKVFTRSLIILRVRVIFCAALQYEFETSLLVMKCLVLVMLIPRKKMTRTLFDTSF